MQHLYSITSNLYLTGCKKTILADTLAGIQTGLHVCIDCALILLTLTCTVLCLSLVVRFTSSSTNSCFWAAYSPWSERHFSFGRCLKKAGGLSSRCAPSFYLNKTRLGWLTAQMQMLVVEMAEGKWDKFHQAGQGKEVNLQEYCSCPSISQWLPLRHCSSDPGLVSFSIRFWKCHQSTHQPESSRPDGKCACTGRLCVSRGQKECCAGHSGSIWQVASAEMEGYPIDVSSEFVVKTASTVSSGTSPGSGLTHGKKDSWARWAKLYHGVTNHFFTWRASIGGPVYLKTVFCPAMLLWLSKR